ncbi:hypothetical protein LEMA_P097970.1 [Plenodomus lingam JN3]|uniref:RRM domain-containing protein n=1 Tax=Leptosphaeria maculans (strain JN3 / isolate v23.1.3 / race Av1-4-5-6-7-8) TaxID=985895 RepID=E5A443_LEPMJ|nr:hypothetical protein LEMA_P097970.1 [Plenodomus lingam JN3]CBX98388.1 hypothetical protein LEMA_P097970.1 [Plenodomus lingam JN3]
MTSSPPETAEFIRHQSLSPASPRPQNVPSPANIPILVEQMDPKFNEPSSYSNGAPTPAQYPPQSQSQSQSQSTPTSTPHYAHHSSASNVNSLEAQGVGSGVSAGDAQSAAFNGTGSLGTQAHDVSSYQNYTSQHQAHATSGQGTHTAYPYSNDNAYAPQAPTQSAYGAYYQTQAQAGTSVDVQALLDSLTPASNHASSGQFAVPQMSAQSTQAPPNAPPLPPPTNLPPRPPTQEQPVTHPNYNPTDDIRSYHPHSQQTSAAQTRNSAQVQSLNMQRQEYSTAPTSSGTGPTTPGHAQRQPAQRSETPDDEDIRWPPEVNRKYEEFLDQERKFVTEGQWDQFPMGSRLFIGNLPTEKVTKRDIFHRFYRHGRLAQISIKQAYGFVQFLDAESCRRALDAEQGQAVRGRKMHLEISKPQRNTKKAESQAALPRRRSRSPDYSRGGTGQTPREGRYGGNVNSMSPRDRDRRFRERDDYRPLRSPSPRGGPRGIRSRDRSRDRFDARYRSRSRTPPRRHRSPSPRRDYTEDGLDLRRRLPHEVPDIQILVLNEGLPRDFIRYVEDTFRSQNLRSNVLIMSGRFPEPAVVRRQILEGVLAIVRLDTTGLAKGKLSVQIFDRRSGANNVQFNDPTTAGLLVNNAKQSQSQPVQPPTPSFGFNQGLPFTQPPPNFPPGPTSQPNISNLIASLDGASLSQLLGAMSGNNVSQNSQPAPNPGFNADLARLLAQVPSPAQTPGFSGHTQPQLAHLGTQFPALASLFATQGQQSAPPVQTPAQPSGTDMSEIMAQLAQYQR